MKMYALEPGDRVSMENGSGAVFIAKAMPHPMYPLLGLFIWRLDDGEISLDALSPMMEVPGQVDSSQREYWINKAIFPPAKKYAQKKRRNR